MAPEQTISYSLLSWKLSFCIDTPVLSDFSLLCSRVGSFCVYVCVSLREEAVTQSNGFHYGIRIHMQPNNCHLEMFSCWPLRKWLSQVGLLTVYTALWRFEDPTLSIQRLVTLPLVSSHYLPLLLASFVTHARQSSERKALELRKCLPKIRL